MAVGLLLIDTYVLVDYSRGIEKKEILKNLEYDHLLAIGVVTQLELMVGCENKADFKSLQKFLSNFEIIQLSKSTSEIAVDLFKKYRLSHGVLIPDMLIASAGLTLEIPLLSKTGTFALLNSWNYFKISEPAYQNRYLLMVDPGSSRRIDYSGQSILPEQEFYELPCGEYPNHWPVHRLRIRLL
jgi:predicted nucleic acid-binding protein